MHGSRPVAKVGKDGCVVRAAERDRRVEKRCITQHFEVFPLRLEVCVDGRGKFGAHQTMRMIAKKYGTAKYINRFMSRRTVTY
jgi:3D (Asp-Asp-Asp) domain-containing protein